MATASPDAHSKARRSVIIAIWPPSVGISNSRLPQLWGASKTRLVLALRDQTQLFKLLIAIPGIADFGRRQ